MKRGILLSDLAERDVEASSNWYEAQVPGLGGRFQKEIDRTLNLVANFPNGAPRIRGRIRFCPLTDFPFQVLFAVYNDRIIVHRVFHTRQHPRKKFARKR